MRPAHVAVPLAGLAAVATRLPDLLLGAAAVLAAAAWLLCVLMAERRPRLHLVGPAAALVLIALPVAADALLPLPGLVVGIAVGIALVAALPPRDDGVRGGTGLAAWSPTLFLAAVLLLPLVLPLLAGPERVALLADRLAPASVAAFVLLAALAAGASKLLTEVRA